MSAEPRTIAELAAALRSRTLTSLAATEQCLDAISLRDRSLNAFITVLAEEARQQARQADAEIAAGRYRGPLHGVPISLKDLIDVEGAPTTAASRVRASHRAAADAPVTRRLREAGAVFIGKTNLHEFALGTTNEDSAYGPARHPLDPTRSPGGSSGGSAASVAAGMAYASIGSDTGGSIRIPSAACGLVGLKPTIGEIPTDGIVPLSGTLDHVGPMCRSVGDAAVVHAALCGSPLRAALAPLTTPVRSLRLGVLGHYFTARLDPAVASATRRAYAHLRQAGATLTDVDVPHASDAPVIYTHIVLSEAAVYHSATLDERGDEYTANVRLRLESGRYLLAQDYLRAMHGRDVLRREVDRALAGLDGLLLPAMAVPATIIGVPTVRVGDTDEPVRSITLRLTQVFNLSGHPAITMPCGRTPEGLPVGLQVVGHRDRTTALLDVARAIEPFTDPDAQ